MLISAGALVAILVIVLGAAWMGGAFSSQDSEGSPQIDSEDDEEGAGG